MRLTTTTAQRPPPTTTTTSAPADEKAITTHQDEWTRGRAVNYRFEYFEQNMIGGCRFVITVEGDAVTNAESTGRNRCFRWNPKDQPPTIDAVFDQVRDATRTASVTTTYGELGIPLRVAVDPIRNAIDDEYSFGVENYTASP
jgi:hypothetical protein